MSTAQYYEDPNANVVMAQHVIVLDSPPQPLAPTKQVTEVGSKTQQEQPMDNKQHRRMWRYIVGIVCMVFVIVILAVVVSIVKQASQKNKSQEALELSAPTPAPTIPLCPEKRVRITEICNLPDLDDDWFGSDKTMDIKVLLNNEQYWPRDLQSDCMDLYGSYKNSCVIPDSTLMSGCYVLKNPVSIAYGGDGTTSPIQPLKVTIYDEDIGTDEFLDIHMPVEQWYFPSSCEDEMELQFNVEGESTRVKMMIDSVEEGEEVVCGADLSAVAVGLDQTSRVLGDMQNTLDEYVRLGDANRLLRQKQDDRQLFIGALISGARVLVSGVGSLAGSFARGAQRSGPLSMLADLTTIGSTWFSSNGPTASGNSGAEYWEKTEDYLKQVLSRFDDIDTKLDGIQSQLQQGFQEMELVINQAFAKQELDDWINGHLAILDSDYRAYLDPGHTPATRSVYEETFRESCRSDHSPFTTFKVLYSHACQDCVLLDGASQQYILDTFVDLAKSNFNSLEERVLWFRKSFGVVVVGALTEAMYLHSVCLYQPDNICQNEDPVWSSRLNDMADALDEVAVSLTEAEKRLQ